MQMPTLRRAAAALAASLLAVLAAACGGENFAAQPTIASFSATPQVLPAGGGQVVLSWSTAHASQITIDNGVGDVSGVTSASATTP